VSGLPAVGGALVLVYLFAAIAMCLHELGRLRELMRRNDELHKRIELSRYMDIHEAIRELEAVGKGQDDISRELDEFSLKHTLTFGMFR
jgi:hypothetical protein